MSDSGGCETRGGPKMRPFSGQETGAKKVKLHSVASFFVTPILGPENGRKKEATFQRRPGRNKMRLRFFFKRPSRISKKRPATHIAVADPNTHYKFEVQSNAS